MKNRLIPVLGDVASRVFLATIHSFCHTVLRCEGRKFDILFGKEQIIFIKNIMKKLKVKDISIGVVLREISLAGDGQLFAAVAGELQHWYLSVH